MRYHRVMRHALLILIVTLTSLFTLEMANVASAQEPEETTPEEIISPDAPDPEPAPAPRPRGERRAPRRPPDPYPPGAQPPGDGPPGYGPEYGPQPYNYRYTDPEVYRGTRAARIGLAAGGASLLGLGALTMLASGITWLVAWGESRNLDENWPNQQCMVGTEGGDALERSRDAADASEVLIAIGAPTFSVGLVMLVVRATWPRTRVAIDPNGLTVRF